MHHGEIQRLEQLIKALDHNRILFRQREINFQVNFIFEFSNL